jgi:hypothetical protein
VDSWSVDFPGFGLSDEVGFGVGQIGCHDYAFWDTEGMDWRFMLWVSRLYDGQRVGIRLIERVMIVLVWELHVTMMDFTLYEKI